MILLEHIVKNHIKIVYICDEKGICEAIGDLPAVPYHSESRDCIELNGAKSCLTEWLSVNGRILVRFTVSRVIGRDSLIAFQAVNVPMNYNPSKLYNEVLSLINEKGTINSQT